MEKASGNKKNLSADIVFEALKTKIENHYWLPGDRMPAENDLAEEYGVSRVTVRTALHKLSALGLVETRTGGGTYISKFNFFNLIASVSNIMFNNISHNDISVYRTTIESAAIDLISQKPILSRYIRELQGCIAKMKKAAESNSLTLFARADYDFHLCLCKMTENNMFIYAYELLYSVLIHYFNDHYRLADTNGTPEELKDIYYRDAIKNHQTILDSMISGDYSMAKALIIHMATSSQPLSEIQPQ